MVKVNRIFSPIEVSYANILSWNVRGIGASFVDRFFKRKVYLSQQRAKLLLHEAVHQRRIQPYIHNTNDGHKVFAMTPQVGQRSCAIIVRTDLSNNIRENSFQQRGRACNLDRFLEKHYYRFTSARLWAKSGTAQYLNSLSDIKFYINLHTVNISK